MGRTARTEPQCLYKGALLLSQDNNHGNKPLIFIPLLATASQLSPDHIFKTILFEMY
jgi:hypothetical protein